MDIDLNNSYFLNYIKAHDQALKNTEVNDEDGKVIQIIECSRCNFK